jgi:hypothetical protein
LNECCDFRRLAPGVVARAAPPPPPPTPPPFCSAQLSSPLHCRMYFLARTFSSSCVLRLTPEARVRCACRVFTTFVRLHGTPPSFGYGDIFRNNLDATSPRDTVHSSSCTSATPPLLRTPALPHPLFGYGNTFGGYLDATSLRDTIPSRRCTLATPPVGLRAQLGAGLDPPLPTTSEAVQDKISTHLRRLHRLSLAPRLFSATATSSRRCTATTPC